MLYHVQAEFRPRVDLATFQAALMPAHSFYRLSGSPIGGSWIICSPEEGAHAWSERLTPYTQPGGWLFVSRFDTAEWYGQMTNEFWAWLREHSQ